MYSITPMEFGDTDKVFLVVAPDGQATGQYFTDETVARATVAELNKPVDKSFTGKANHLFSTSTSY